MKKLLFTIVLLSNYLFAIDMTNFPTTLFMYTWGNGGYDFSSRTGTSMYSNCARYYYADNATNSWQPFKKQSINSIYYCVKNPGYKISFSELSQSLEYNVQYNSLNSTYITTNKSAILMRTDQNFILPSNYDDFLALNPYAVYLKSANEDSTLTRIEIIDIYGNMSQIEVDTSTLNVLSTSNYDPNFTKITTDENQNSSTSELENIPFDYTCSFDTNSDEIESYNGYDTYTLYNGTIVTITDTGSGYFVNKEYPIAISTTENSYLSCKDGKVAAHYINDEYGQTSRFEADRLSGNLFQHNQKTSTDGTYLLSTYKDLTDGTGYTYLYQVDNEANTQQTLEYDSALISSIDWNPIIETPSFQNMLTGVVDPITCADGAPSNFGTNCDRSCEDVGYITQTDGSCSQQQDCEALATTCVGFCGTMSNIAEYQCDSGDILGVNNICECIDGTTSNNNNNNDQNNTDNNSNTNNNSTDYNDAPAAGNGSGGNSLTDDMSNLGTSVDNNTKSTDDNTLALKNNTQELINSTSTLSSILDFLDLIYQFALDPSTITSIIDNTIQQTKTKYSDDIFTDSGCLQIQPVQISYHGRTVTFLSQEFINEFFPVELFKNVVIFGFVFAAVMTYFRSE